MLRHYYIPPAQQLRAGFVIVTLVTGLVSAASASARPVRWRSPHVPAAASMRAHLGDAGVELPARSVLPASFRERTGCTDYWLKVKGRAETLGTPGANRTVHGEESWLGGSREYSHERR